MSYASPMSTHTYSDGDGGGGGGGRHAVVVCRIPATDKATNRVAAARIRAAVRDMRRIIGTPRQPGAMSHCGNDGHHGACEAVGSSDHPPRPGAVDEGRGEDDAAERETDRLEPCETGDVADGTKQVHERCPSCSSGRECSHFSRSAARINGVRLMPLPYQRHGRVLSLMSARIVESDSPTAAAACRTV